MAVAFLVGRIIVGLYFLVNAYGHLVKNAGAVGYASSKGIKSPKLAVVGTGILLLIGGLSVILGVFVGWGLLALLVFMIPVTFRMHAYWKETDPMAKMSQRIAFQKNIAIIGFLIMAYGFAVPWVYSAF